MKILMLSYEFPPLGGGGSKVVHGLSSELVRLGHRVDLVTMHYRGLPRREEVNGVRVYRVPCVRLKRSLCTTPEMVSYDLSALLSLTRPRRNGYDLNHTHFIYPDGLVSLMAKRWSGLRYVVTAHGSDVPGYNPDRFRLLHRLLAPLWTRVARGAERIVCPSQSIRSLILARCDDARTQVIPNGFDVNRLRPSLDKRKQILVVSRLFERKGVQYLLEAVDRLDPDCRVHVVGDGPYLDALRAIAGSIDARVHFWGWLENDSAQLKELYEHSSIFVLPSEAENFPIVLLEAMAAGMAIVTTRGTGTAEVVGNAGLLVEPRRSEPIRTALRELLASPQLCRRLGAEARRRLEDNFGWTAVAKSHVELYESHVRA